MLTKYTAYVKGYIQSELPKKLSQLTNDVGYVTKDSDISGTASMAIADKDGNPITTTYEKKVDAQIALNKKADKATTLSGYGITDSYTRTEEDTKLKDKADAANVYTKQQVLDKLDLKADKAITLAGYYIGDAYTKTEVDDKLAKKADLESLHMADVLSAIDARLKKTDAEATYIKKTELADEIKPATTTSLGAVIIGDNLTVDTNGRVSAKNSYVLPVATASVLGGVKQGTDITIDKDGVLSVDYTDFTANCTEENFAKLYAES